MATTYHYNVWLQQRLNGVWANISAQDVKVNFKDFNNTAITAGSTSNGTPSAFAWRIEVYKVVNGTTTNLNGSKVRVTASGAHSDCYQQVSTGSDFFTLQIDERGINTKGGIVPFVIKPTFTVKLKAAEDPSESSVAFANKPGVKFTGIQSVTFTKATVFPEIPTAMITELTLPALSGQPAGPNVYSRIHYDASLKQYVGIKVKYNSTYTTTTYSTVYYTPGSAGTKVREVPIGAEKSTLGNKGPVYKAAQSVLINAIDSAKVANTTVAPPPGTGSGTGQYTTNSGTEPQGGDRWNPPPHPNTKGVSREWSLSKVVEAENYTVTGEYSAQFLDQAVNRGVLGRIFQDADFAKDVNKNTKLSKPGDLWGFRFMYNPNSISYVNTGYTNIDINLANDVANLLAANINIQIELYINRILDLTDLQGNSSDKQAYTPPLSKAAEAGLVNRGTEYDIEFLYRVCNGDPKTDAGPQPLFSDSYAGVTSDVGYMISTPVWIVLNDNLRIFGAIQSMTVDHVIFDKRMVPIFSKVNLTIMRYPAVAKYDAKTTSKDTP